MSPNAKPFCARFGTEGRPFVLINRVMHVLQDAGQDAQAQEVWERFGTCESYKAILDMCREWVEFE